MYKKKIVFTFMGVGVELFPPKPAKKNLPSWYKELGDYVDGKKQLTDDAQLNQTGKRCMPMFDAMTFGYLMYTNVDIYVTLDERGETVIAWASKGAIHSHSNAQLSTYKNRNPSGPIPKFLSEYGIETPSGYSAYFCPPINHENNIIIFSGVVDTDQYTNIVNLPFLIKTGFEGLIPAGTPIAQVVPFKRESWKLEVNSKKKNVDKAMRVKETVSTLFQNGYRHKYWQRKGFD